MGDFKDLDTGGIKQRTCALVAEHGFEAWYREYSERADMLTEALARYNNGRMKRYLCELFIKSDIGRLRVIMQRAVEFPSNPKEAGPLFRELAQKFEVQSVVLPVTLDQEKYDAAQTLKNELECGRAAGERDG